MFIKINDYVIIDVNEISGILDTGVDTCHVILKNGERFNCEYYNSLQIMSIICEETERKCDKQLFSTEEDQDEK